MLKMSFKVRLKAGELNHKYSNSNFNIDLMTDRNREVSFREFDDVIPPILIENQQRRIISFDGTLTGNTKPNQ